MKRKKPIRYVIAGGNRFIGFDKVKSKDILVYDYQDAVKFRYSMALRVLEKLDSELKNLEEWRVISTVEARRKQMEVPELDIDNLVDCLEINFDLLIKRKEFLELEYLEIEKEITDIYHAIEFYTLNAQKGYQLYKMMQERLIRRRKNKNETRKINAILLGGIKGLTDRHTKEKIERVNHQQYHPRVLKELFDK